MRRRTHRAKVDAEGGVLAPARTERYYVQPKAAPATAKNTMSDLLLLGIRALERQNREGLDLGPTGPDGAPPVPSITVNCKQLAERGSMSARTVRTHLDLLLKMGAITAKAWHGTRADFELWINPKYLWHPPKTRRKASWTACKSARFCRVKQQNFRLV